MKTSLVISFNNYLDNWFSNPEENRTVLIRNRNAWTSFITTFFMGMIFLAGFLLIGKEYQILISYMIVLLAGFGVIQILMIVFRRDVLFLSFLANIWIIAISFIYTLKLGGIAYSAGLALAGFEAVISSLTYQNKRCIIITMALYIVTIIVAGVLHPWLTIPQEMTPAMNNNMFVLTLVIVSVYNLFRIFRSQNQNKVKAGVDQNVETLVSIPINQGEFMPGTGMKDLFMKRINDLLDMNIDDPQFGISQLCKSMGTSRAQIYRKFKAINNRTLHDYLRFYRLSRAKELLMTTSLNVSEVAYRTGFINLSHFSRIFSEEFGKHPRELRKQKIPIN